MKAVRIVWLLAIITFYFTVIKNVEIDVNNEIIQKCVQTAQ